MCGRDRDYLIKYIRFLKFNAEGAGSALGPAQLLLCCCENSCQQGPVVQSPISTNPGLTLNKTYRVNPGLALIGL